MPTPEQKTTSKSFPTVRRIEIINGNQRVILDDNKHDHVAIEGVITDSRFDASLSSDQKTLYLVGFDGTLRLPHHVEVRIKRGVDDLRRELFETYAPAIHYSEVVEAETEFTDMASRRQVPTQDIMKCLEKIYGATGLSLFAPYSELHAPATLQAVNYNVQMGPFDREHQFKSYLEKALAGAKADPAADLGVSRTRDLDAHVGDIVYAVGRKLDMPSDDKQQMRKAMLTIAHHPNYVELRTGRNESLAGGRSAEVRAEVSRRAAETRKEHIVESLTTIERQGLGFGAALVGQLESEVRPVNGDVLVDRLVATAIQARSSPNSGHVVTSVAKVAVDTGSIKNAEEWNNARLALKVGSYVAYAVSQATLDDRFADRPDRSPTAAEVQRALQVADNGRTAAQLDFEERRPVERRYADDLGAQLAQVPSDEARTRSHNVMKETTQGDIDRLQKEQQQPPIVPSPTNYAWPIYFIPIAVAVIWVAARLAGKKI